MTEDQNHIEALRQRFSLDNVKKVTTEAEGKLILEVLEAVNQNKSMAAKVLSIDRKTLYTKLREFSQLNDSKVLASGV
jgi:two-component system response regulator HydG